MPGKNDDDDHDVDEKKTNLKDISQLPAES